MEICNICKGNGTLGLPPQTCQYCDGIGYRDNNKIKDNKKSTITEEIDIYKLIYEIPSDTKVICADDLYRFHMGELQIYDHSIHEWRKTYNSLKQIFDMRFRLVEEE